MASANFGATMGSPVALGIENRDWKNWTKKMSPLPEDRDDKIAVTKPRPGHADLNGVLKYNRKDVRDILERASARAEELYNRGSVFGIPGEQIDGMDVAVVKAAGDRAVASARAGEGPKILEMLTYRYRGHSMSDPAKYRTREEVQDIREHRDPIELLRKRMLESGRASENELKEIDREMRARVNEAAEFAQSDPEPDPSELYTDVTA